MSESGKVVSIVVPFYNEADNVRFVLAELRAALPEAEILAVDDGSTDGTWDCLRASPGVRGLRFPRNQGQSAAIYAGLKAATRAVCGLMDGDGQTDPAEFARLLAELRRGEADVVCGYRADRHDVWNRRAASWIANTIRRGFLHDQVRDTGCAQKVFPRWAVDLLVPFRGLHRFLPALFRQAGLRVVELPVNHRSRRAGVTKYTNLRRAVVGLHDLFGVAWLLRRKINPCPLETSNEHCDL